MRQGVIDAIEAEICILSARYKAISQYIYNDKLQLESRCVAQQIDTLKTIVKEEKENE